MSPLCSDALRANKVQNYDICTSETVKTDLGTMEEKKNYTAFTSSIRLTLCTTEIKSIID